MRDYAYHQAQQTDNLPNHGVLIELWRDLKLFFRR